ncbi:MAG: hypothetical protein NTAFB05_16560 [Nitrobacter sp.]|uniref:DUF2793 domain-containing protein n=1 Tax=Nitrobacter sp. TaxID=29420 RepID=UPI00387DE65C
MTDTPNLGLPYIDGSQAQKHVTHNEALRILDAVVQIGVLDRTRTTPPSSPADGERHVVAGGATGAWAGKDNTIATWQDDAWAFLAPKTGWCIWSAADSSLFVFGGAAWQGAGGTDALDNVAHLGVNTAASSPNLLSVKSNAALFAAIDAADGGTGDMRLQLSKEGSANTASVFFSDNFSGRAEFGLVGADTFKLKVSPDGSSWTEAFNIDQDTGNLTLPCGLSLSGVISPAQITTDQNDYSPAGLAAASVLQIKANAARNISGLAGGAEGRCLAIINVGSQPVTLLDESTSSSASNRLTLGGDLTIAAKQAAILRYDGTAARWQVIGGGARAVATKSQQQAGADNTSAVTPAHQQDHDSAAKAWGYFTVSGGTYTLSAGFNIAGISKNSTGNLTISFTTPFASTSFAVIATVNQFGGVGVTETIQEMLGSRSSYSTTLAITGTGSAGVAIDRGFSFMAFGRQ